MKEAKSWLLEFVHSHSSICSFSFLYEGGQELAAAAVPVCGPGQLGERSGKLNWGIMASAWMMSQDPPLFPLLLLLIRGIH